MLQFIRINEEEINIGLITKIEIGTKAYFDPDCPNFKRWTDGEMIEDATIRRIFGDIVRLYVFGREHPIETTNTSQIARLKEIWESREIHTI